MLISNLSNILSNCENNDYLIKTFIDNFDNFTNIFTNLNQKFYETFDFSMNIFSFDLKQKLLNSKESLKMNYLFNSVYFFSHAPMGMKQIQLDEIMLNNNEFSYLKNNHSRLCNFLKNDKNNNKNNDNINISKEKNLSLKQKFLKSNSLNNITNNSKYSTNSNGNYGFTINLNNPSPNEIEKNDSNRN